MRPGTCSCAWRPGILSALLGERVRRFGRRELDVLLLGGGDQQRARAGGLRDAIEVPWSME